jgi:hypothetical protein
MVVIPGNFQWNASSKNEMTSSLTSWCKFRFSVIVRKKYWRHQQFLLGPFASFIRIGGICSVRWSFLFHVLLYSRFYLFIRFCCKHTVMLPFSLLYNSAQEFWILNVRNMVPCMDYYCSCYIYVQTHTLLLCLQDVFISCVIQSFFILPASKIFRKLYQNRVNLIGRILIFENRFSIFIF